MRKLRGENGNGLVEYALVFMVFISMLLGIVDFSRALYTYHFLSNVARDATRWAAARGNTCTNDGSCAAPASSTDIQTYVTDNTPPGIDPAQLIVQPSWALNRPYDPASCNSPATENSPGCPVQVTVNYPFTFVVPFISTSPLTLSSSSEMTILH